MRRTSAKDKIRMKERLASWRQAFEEDDNSIVSSLRDFAWDFAVFQSTEQIVKIAPEGPDGEKRLNGLIFDLLRRTYWGHAILTIRKLVDRGPLRGPYGVSSLRALITDIRECREKITRRFYVEDIAGLEYDDQRIRHRAQEYLLTHPSGASVWMGPEHNEYPTMQGHLEFDFLSGVDTGGRSEDDLIRPDVFERLENRLKRLDVVADHASIYYAHAASGTSRLNRGLQQWGSEDAKEALQLLSETAQLVSRWFLNSGIGEVLPAYFDDHFVYLDHPLISVTDIPLLESGWRYFSTEAFKWAYVKDCDL